jgi:dipeptidyl aminopeptidase/acylaminoacyl peptidase
MKKTAVILIAALCAGPTLAQGKRPLSADDIYRLQDVRDPQRSPDGKWVAYTVTRAIKATDKNDTDVWMVSWDGRQQVQLTFSPDSESSPRWSPDGRYLAFVSSRQGAKGGQIWLLNRAGGEAARLTDVKGGVSDYEWSPDSKRFVLVVNDPDPAEADPEQKEGAAKTPKPIVVDRYRFKQDIRGYLDARRSHLYLYDIEAKKTELLTPGSFDESAPAWSPDGAQIAFIRRHGGADADKDPNQDVFVIAARAGAQPTRLTTTRAGESGPIAWSPDGKTLSFLLGDEVKFSAYVQSRLVVMPASGGQARSLTDAIDRPVRSPVFTRDGSSIVFGVVDDRAEHVARIPVAGGRVERVISGRRVVSGMSDGPDGAFAVLASTATEPPEIHALENGALRRLSRHNDAWLQQVLLGTTDDFTSISKDGTEVHGLIVKPPTYTAGRTYPTLLRIHGGPNGQDAHAFNFEREFFAANGYAVVAVNYRGSNGRGSAYQKAIFADWGNKEVADLLGAMDHAVKIGIADPDRLGIGGWSYGGILTNYTIATDRRFKAATSGAGSSNQITMYGTDQYITQYDLEIGPPWKAQDLWVKISYPFFHADRIRTPTLFMGGEKDFNVPITGSEQMYQALRTLGVDTQLVIYPNQFHGITIPSYKKDRLERYVAWYDRYLKKPGATTTAGQSGRSAGS